MSRLSEEGGDDSKGLGVNEWWHGLHIRGNGNYSLKAYEIKL